MVVGPSNIAAPASASAARRDRTDQRPMASPFGCREPPQCKRNAGEPPACNQPRQVRGSVGDRPWPANVQSAPAEESTLVASRRRGHQNNHQAKHRIKNEDGLIEPNRS